MPRVLRQGATDPSTVLDVKLWKHDGTTFMSDDAYGHQCTVTGALWTPQGRNFDRVDDNISLGDDGLFAFTASTPFTIGAWCNRNSTGSIQYIAGKSNSGGVFKGYHLDFESTGELFFYMTPDQAGANKLYVQTTKQYSPNQFYFVTATYTGSSLASGVSLYENGRSSATTTVSDTLSGDITTTANFSIGSRNAAASMPFGGIIGEVIVYNRALTPVEINNLYIATCGRYA